MVAYTYNGEIDVDDELIEPETTAEDRVAHYRFFEVCLSDELLEAIPFCFNPALAFLKAHHVVTAVILEQFAFEHSQRGFSIQMVEYRIRSSGNLSYGLFNICDMTEKKDWWVATMMRSWNIENKDEDIRRLLFVQIIATLGCSPVVTDKDMDAPSNWMEILHGRESHPSEPVGHRPHGRTLCIHSLAVCPRLQGLGLGTATLKSYLQRMNTINAADRVALLCRQSEIRFFQRCGFKNIGRSYTETLRGEYFDMVFDLPGPGKLIDWNGVAAVAKGL
ncbi:polyamine acetyltransferase [Trichoderma arundinaceum]|uniref:Polyamine acetyltransferase n=1 Tax=Trichoderma arundinaceum TaxID=490622 RepID=A0A395NL17_TRIAR|nr:polyamine acetyltransferase [Trichoderma arundinaceum]